MIADYAHKLRLFSRDARRFLVAGTLIGIAWYGIRVVLLNLYLLRLGYGTEFIGLFTAIGALAFSVACPLAGTLTGRWSSRVTMAAGLIVVAAAQGALPLVEVLPAAWGQAWLLAISTLVYSGFALYLVNTVPFMMDTARAAERNHFFAVFTAVVPLAGFTGSLLSGALPGLLASSFDLSLEHPAAYRYPLWLISLLAFAAAMTLLSCNPSARRTPEATSDPAPGRGPRPHAVTAPLVMILVLSLVATLRFSSRTLVITFFNVYLDDGLGVSTALIGALTAAGQLLSVPAALSAAPLVGRWGNVRLIAWALGAMTLSLLPLALVPTWPAAGAGFVGMSATFAATVGPVRVFSQEMVPTRWRLLSSGAVMMGSGLGLAAVAIAGGYAIANLGYPSLFLGAAALTAMSVLLMVGYFRGPRAEPVPEGEP